MLIDIDRSWIAHWHSLRKKERKKKTVFRVYCEMKQSEDAVVFWCAWCWPKCFILYILQQFATDCNV